VLAACLEVGEHWEEPVPEPHCDDHEEWSVFLDVLAGRILWDYDFCMEDSFLDVDPVVAKKKMREMGMLNAQMPIRNLQPRALRILTRGTE
jgi:hypothetical protein